jgi:hypothetical protein
MLRDRDFSDRGLIKEADANPQDELLQEFADSTAAVEAGKIAAKYEKDPGLFRRVLLKLNKRMLGNLDY